MAGFFLLYIFGVKRPVGKFFLDYFSVKIAFSWIATVLAAVVMSFPLMYRSARGAFEQVDENLPAAARTLGMSEWCIFRKVLFANALPGIVSGGVLAFAGGLGEFGATAMIAGNIAGKTRTLPMAVYSEVAAGNMDAAYRYVAGDRGDRLLVRDSDELGRAEGGPEKALSLVRRGIRKQCWEGIGNQWLSNPNTVPA